MREWLKSARVAKGISVSDMAKLLGISASFYYKIETGVRNPTMELAKKISDILQKTVDELFFANELDETYKYEQSATLEYHMENRC